MTVHLLPPQSGPAAVRRLAAAMPERELQQRVADLCKEMGLFHFHPLHSVGSERGWPDSVVVGTRVLFRELKAEAGRPSSEQTALGYKLRAAGQNWKIWRPSDLLGGAILKELREISGEQGELWEGA